MRYGFDDSEAFDSLDPRNIRVYLRTHQWVQQATDRADVWQLSGDDGDFEVLAPSREFADFSQQMTMLLYTLSVAENRSEFDILRDLSSLAFDIQYVRKAQAGPPGTVSLAEAARTYEAARDLISAAATSIEVQTPVLPVKSERSTEVRSLLNRVLTGPPEAGSFVASIWVPVPPRPDRSDRHDLRGDDEDPFERQVTRRLNQAVAAASRAVEQSSHDESGLQAFLGQESVGLNADLCDALVRLAGGRSRPLEVRFSWALDRPADGVSPVETFDAVAIDILKSAAEALRTLQGRDEVIVRGRVQRLARRESGGGYVTIEGSVVGEDIEELRVEVSISRENFELAVDALRRQIDVEISGTLRARGLRFALVRHGDLVILEP